METTKRPSGIKYEHGEGNTVFTNQLNGETYVVNWAEYSQEILDQLLTYGIQQKFSDFKVGHFSGKDPLLKKEERLHVMIELDEMLKAGEWKAKRAEGQNVSSSSIITNYTQADKAGRKLLRQVFAVNIKLIAQFDLIK